MNNDEKISRALKLQRILEMIFPLFGIPFMIISMNIFKKLESQAVNIAIIFVSIGTIFLCDKICSQIIHKYIIQLIKK